MSEFTILNVEAGKKLLSRFGLCFTSGRVCVTPGQAEQAVSVVALQAGAQQVNTQVAEDSWWIGRYDREQKLYRDDEKGY